MAPYSSSSPFNPPQTDMILLLLYWRPRSHWWRHHIFWHVISHRIRTRFRWDLVHTHARTHTRTESYTTCSVIDEASHRLLITQNTEHERYSTRFTNRTKSHCAANVSQLASRTRAGARINSLRTCDEESHVQTLHTAAVMYPMQGT